MRKKQIMPNELTSQERLDLVEALFQRSDLFEQAKEAFRKAYPDASESMIGTATFHVYVDGIGAALDWLVSAELFLRNPDIQVMDDGWHLLYHLYNWHQFSFLIARGPREVLDIIEEIKEAIADKDEQAALAATRYLKERFEGGLCPPQFKVD